MTLGRPIASSSTPAPADEYLLKFVHLRERSCPSCSRALYKLAVPRCPFCRQALQLQLGMTFPKLGEWLAIALPLLMGAGLGSLFVVAVFVRGLRMSSAPSFLWLSLVNIPLAALAVICRRRILRWPRGTRRGVALVSIVFGLVPYVMILRK